MRKFKLIIATILIILFIGCDNNYQYHFSNMGIYITQAVTFRITSMQDKKMRQHALLYKKMTSDCKLHNDNCIDCKLYNFSKAIFSTLPKDEILFLSELGFYNSTIHYLIDKYGTKFKEEIQNKISDSELAIIFKELEVPQYGNFCQKLVLVFVHTAIMIREKKATMEDTIGRIESFYLYCRLIDVYSNRTINNTYSDDFTEARLTKFIESFSEKIMSLLSDTEIKYLSDAHDVFIVRWLHNVISWGAKQPEAYIAFKDIAFMHLVAVRALIDDDMKTYLEKKYDLKIQPYEDGTVFEIACAHVAGKLKNKNYDIETCLKLFDARHIARANDKYIYDNAGIIYLSFAA